MTYRNRTGNSKNSEHPYNVYDALHTWVRRYKERKRVCEHCLLPHQRTHFANVSGEYRRDVDDYIELCPKCHKTYDRTD